jgi:hypothetical protein
VLHLHRPDARKIEVPCLCSLDGDTGHCSSVLGTDIYRETLKHFSEVIDVNECHTNDRFNIRAHRDSCGIGKSHTWDHVVKSLFDVNHWAYVQNPRISSCVKSFFSDSYEIMSLNAAILSVGYLGLILIVN